MPPKCKMIILGETGVGKSSLLERYSLDTFTENIAATIGVDFRLKNFNFIPSNSSSASPSIPIVLNLWDTAGQERYRALSSSFFRGTDAIVCVYDVTREESFAGVKRWLDQARAFLPDTPALLIANKIDLLLSSSSVDDDENSDDNNNSSSSWRQREQAIAKDFAAEYQMLYCRCSAKTKEGVIDAFDAIAQKACESPEFKEKLGVNGQSQSQLQQQQQQQESSSTPAKRIDLNSARNNNNDDQNNNQGYYGCGQC